MTDAQARPRRRPRLLPVLVFGLVGTALLVALGLWQVQRLAWKTAIIDRIEARLAEPPVPVPLDPTPEADRYRQVRATGSIGAGELDVYTSAPPYGVGYRVVVPMVLADGRRILLDRGFVPVGDKDLSRRTGPVTVTGALDWPRETDRFTPDPDLKEDIWFARDVAQMSQALDTLPVMLVAAASDDPAAPMPLPVGVNIANNHLQYAITWFGLAVVWAGMTAHLLWRIKRPID